MKKRLLIIVLFGFFYSKAQTLKVLNALDEVPITNVSITNKQRTLITQTDSLGTADISDFMGADILYIRRLGFVPKKISPQRVKNLNFIVVLYPTDQQLDEVVLSVSRWEQQKKDIPQKIVSQKAEIIRFTNPQTAADLLAGSAQVYVQKSQLGGGSPMIRGFATNRVLLSVDGVRMNNAIFRGGNVQNVLSIDPFNVKNTEIIFGPGSVIYGSDAIGGVMNFFTKEPDFSNTDSLKVTGEADLRYSTANNEKTSHAELTISKKQWAFLSSLSYSNFDDLRMGSHGPAEYLRNQYVHTKSGADFLVRNDEPKTQKPTGYNQFSLMQKIRWTPHKSWDLSLGLHYSETSNYPRYDRLLQFNGDLPRSAAWYYGPQKWAMANLQASWRGVAQYFDAVKLNVAGQYFEESRNNRDFEDLVLNRTKEKVNAFSINTDFEKKIDEKLKTFYGLEYIYNQVLSSGETLNIGDLAVNSAQSRYPNDSDWQSVATYLSLEYKVRKNFTFLSGLRYTHVFLNAVFDNSFFDFPFDEANVNTGAFTGSVGLSWFPKKSLQITFNGSTGFRAPNIDDIGKIFDSEPGAVVVPNPDIESEYVYNADFSIRKNWNDRVIFSASTFYTFLKDALVRRDFSFNGQSFIMFQGELSRVQSIQNASRAYTYGFEFEMQTYFNQRLSFNANLNLIKGKEELEDGSEVALRHVAPLFGAAHLVWKNQKLKFDFFLNYNGSFQNSDLPPSELSKPWIYASDADGNPYAPSWYTLNFRSQYQLSQFLTLSAALENITDQRYRPYSSGIAGPGRNLILGARVLF